jgi:hypothetical protein
MNFDRSRAPVGAISKSDTSRFAMQKDDQSAKRVTEKSMFGVPQAEFNRRVRFRDRAGYRYAVPRSTNALYRSYVRKRMINPIENGDDEEGEDSEDGDGGGESIEEEEEEATTTRRTGVVFRQRRIAPRRAPLGLALGGGGKSMLFTRKPRTRKLAPTLKPGTVVRLLDMRSKDVYEARVELFLQRGLESSGHAILRDIVAKGPLLDPLEFPVDTTKSARSITGKK